MTFLLLPDGDLAFTIEGGDESPKGRCTMLYAPREEGQGLVEYGLILVLIAILVVVILRTVGGKISTMFSTISSAMPGPPTPTP